MTQNSSEDSEINKPIQQGQNGIPSTSKELSANTNEIPISLDEKVFLEQPFQEAEDNVLKEKNKSYNAQITFIIVSVLGILYGVVAYHYSIYDMSLGSILGTIIAPVVISYGFGVLISSFNYLFTKKFRNTFHLTTRIAAILISLIYIYSEISINQGENGNKSSSSSITNSSNAFSGQKNTIEAQTINKKVDCIKNAPFGDVNICLPEIDGMTECYSLPSIREMTSKSLEGNYILGYYLNNATYKQVNKLNEIAFDDYFIIYSINAMKDKKAGQSELKDAADLMGGNFSKENWNDFYKKFIADKNTMTIGRPVLIEGYSLNDKVRTYEVIAKYQVNNVETISVITMNIILIKERLIWLGYYKNYDGQESIKSAKSKNDYIVLLLMDENN